MSQDVLCPQCQKRYTLPDDPPETYPCTQCGMVMDLSAFRQPAPVAAAASTPASAPAPAPAVSEPARPRRPAPGSRRPAGRTRAPAGRDAYREAPPGRRAAGRKNNNMAIGVVAIVLLLALVIIVSTSRSDESDFADTGPSRGGTTSADVDPEPAFVPPPVTRTVPKKRTRTRRGKPNLSRVTLKTHEWLPEIDSETRSRVDEAINTMYRGGRDAVEAREYVVAVGRPICGRLINEFLAIQKSPGFDNREGASMASVIDGTLREIDGYIENEYKELRRIRAWGLDAAPSFIERTAKRWTWWWENEEWRTNPRDAWDPHDDPENPKGEKDKEAPKKKVGGGYDKPAGR
jgi:hypothetical protein